jgi:hypothetical protein
LTEFLMILGLQNIFHELRICLIHITSQKSLTLPYKYAHEYDVSCPYVMNHTLFDDQTT